MSAKRGRGRRPGDPEVTKQSILTAARQTFGEAGFDRATMRQIATLAGVDPALIHHHFGTKQELFAAAHEFPVSPVELIKQVALLPREQRAEAIVRVYLTVLGAPESPALSLIKAATTNDAAAQMMREYIGSVLLDNAPLLIEFPDARLRIALVGSHMIGVIVARSVIGLPEMDQIEVEELIPMLVPMVERYLFEPNLV